MSPEALALGVLSAVRAVPMTVTYALLLAERRRRLVSTYIAAGVVVSLAVGVAAVLVFEAEAGTVEQARERSVLDLVLGGLALTSAGAYGAGLIGRGRRGNPLDGPGALGRVGARLRRPTVALAAGAGLLTNLPGVYYLAGLVAILSTQPSVAGGAIQVLVYTLLRLGGPIAVLVLVVARPETTVSTVLRVQAWGVRHRRVLVATVLGAVGLYLLVTALVDLTA